MITRQSGMYHGSKRINFNDVYRVLLFLLFSLDSLVVSVYFLIHGRDLMCACLDAFYHILSFARCINIKFRRLSFVHDHPRESGMDVDTPAVASSSANSTDMVPLDREPHSATFDLEGIISNYDGKLPPSVSDPMGY